MKRIFTAVILACIFIGALSAEPLKSPQHEMKITEVISEVEGDYSVFYKKSSGFYVRSNKIESYELDNEITDVIYSKDGKEIYIKNILSYTTFGTYTKGEISGNTITINLPQTLQYDEKRGYGQNLCVLKYENINGYDDGVVQEDITEVTLSIDSSTGDFILELPGEPGEYMLGVAFSDDYSWSGYGDFTQRYFPSGVDFVYMPEAATPVNYAYVESNNGYEVGVAFYEDYIYVKGLCQIFPEGVVRAVYDSAKGVAMLPQDQCVGVLNGRTLVRTKVLTRDNAGALVLGPPEASFNLSVDMEKHEIAPLAAGNNSQSYLAFNQSADEVNYFQLLGNFTLKEQSSYAGVPRTPYGLTFSDRYFIDYGYVTLSFYLSPISMENTLLKVDNIYYNVYVNGDIIEFEYNPYIGAYRGLSEPTVNIPYDFSNDNDIIGRDSYHEIGLYTEGFDSLAVRATYIYEDKETNSEAAVLYFGENNISDINANEASKVEYFDLGGKKVDNPKNGFFIKRSVMSDGSVEIKKVFFQ